MTTLRGCSLLLRAGPRRGPLLQVVLLSLPEPSRRWVASVNQRCAVGGGTKATPRCQGPLEMQSHSCKGLRGPALEPVPWKDAMFLPRRQGPGCKLGV